ncbi:MBL fold metallo-hydrolase [Lachnospiraceae bacterium MD1]|jgi:L-ascorbate metabolism protein UlaG (beta-lactamase superfamily)|uniref:MBL fold metallo-hydrolase n=1 Tax=Variimorphobacter saccharofermentans TaxID=2755051 RepID=A0A839JY37_9FIRM|nr:MBL fold metallo-hydrolase [Variimorphobacter saccharofermentans]MBB2182583.1 MBL fold metallo-hydrolase [Variimorphobacter saccharofermentans]
MDKSNDTVTSTENVVKNVLPITDNNTGKVLIQTVSTSKTYLYTSYIISSSKGQNVVVDPTEMPQKSIVDIKPVAICSTHAHPDHTDIDYLKTYQVPKILYEKGKIYTRDFRIYSIPSSHSDDNVTEDSGNVIIVFEVDGLRIAHMGDIGQNSLTREQVLQLGNIDIAFMQFENSYSDMTLENEKGFRIIEQLNPRIIIPTHYFDSTIPVLEIKYGQIKEYNNYLSISKEELPSTKLNVFRVLNNHIY